MTQLAWNKLAGQGGVPLDPVGAIPLLKERAMQNDSDALWILGICSEYGIGCEKNLVEANMFYNVSYSLGSPIGSLLAFYGGDGRGSKIMAPKQRM